MIKKPIQNPSRKLWKEIWHPRWLIVEGCNLWIAGIFKYPLNPQNLGKWIQVKLGSTNITNILLWERYSSLVIKSFTVLYPGKFKHWLPITGCFCVGITWRFFLLHSSKNGFHVPTSGKKKSCRSERRMPYDSNWSKHHVSASSLYTNYREASSQSQICQPLTNIEWFWHNSPHTVCLCLGNVMFTMTRDNLTPINVRTKLVSDVGDLMSYKKMPDMKTTTSLWSSSTTRQSPVPPFGWCSHPELPPGQGHIKDQMPISAKYTKIIKNWTIDNLILLDSRCYYDLPLIYPTTKSKPSSHLSVSPLSQDLDLKHRSHWGITGGIASKKKHKWHLKSTVGWKLTIWKGIS